MAISVTDFTLAAPSGLTVKTATLVAADTSGAVTHGVITESATPPLAGDGSWLAWNGADGTRPAGLQSQTLTAGAHTLYGHVKDAAGNRGSSAGQGVTVTIVSGTPQSFVIAGVNTAMASENTASAYNATNGALGLGSCNVGGYDTGKGWSYQHLGVLWTALTVTGEITSLKFKMQVATGSIVGGASKAPMPLKIRAITSGAVTAFSTSDKPSVVTKTTSAVQWTIQPTPAIGSWITTPELVSLVAESGWTNGRALGFVVEISDDAGTGAGTPLATFNTSSGAWQVGFSGNSLPEGSRHVLLVNGAT